MKMADFQVTDNTCGPEPPLKLTRPANLEDLADDVTWGRRCKLTVYV